MTSFESHSTIITRLKILSEKLSLGTLTQEELEEFELLSRQLYERAVILNYKAKEEVFKHKNNDLNDEIKENVIVDSTQEEAIQEETIIETPLEEQEPEEEKVEEDFSFDFSDGFETSDELEEEVGDEEEVVAKVSEEIIEKVQEEIVDKTQDELVDEIQDEIEIIQESIEEVEVKQSEINTDNSSNEYYQRFIKANEEAANDRLANVKIETLKGAFGLNDRLLFIRELFHGNADDFNAVVELLDTQSDSVSALSKLSQIALEKKWEKDSSAVDEFAHLVIRRYVG